MLPHSLPLPDNHRDISYSSFLHRSDNSFSVRNIAAQFFNMNALFVGVLDIWTCHGSTCLRNGNPCRLDFHSIIGAATSLELLHRWTATLSTTFTVTFEFYIHASVLGAGSFHILDNFLTFPIMAALAPVMVVHAAWASLTPVVTGQYAVGTFGPYPNLYLVVLFC